MSEAQPIPNKRLFLILGVIGSAVMGFGVIGLFVDGMRTHPESWIKWFLGAALVHDFLWAPAVFAAGFLISRHVSPPHRPFVQGGLIVSAMVTLVALPFVLGYGKRPNDPSALPNNYLANLLIVIAIVWLGTGVLWGWTRWKRRREHH